MPEESAKAAVVFLPWLGPERTRSIGGYDVDVDWEKRAAWWKRPSWVQVAGVPGIRA